MGRLGLGRGGPRELGAIREGIVAADQLRTALPDRSAHGAGGGQGCPRAAGHAGGAAGAGAEARGAAVRAGRQFRRRRLFEPELDEQRTLRDDGRRLIAEMQARYAAESGVATLKIKHNQVIGYHIEVTATHAERMPTAPDGPFIHRQTLGTAVRFTTVALAELDRGIAEAADRALAIELAIFPTWSPR
jgi:DNA mismatch repair protein MutS